MVKLRSILFLFLTFFAISCRGSLLDPNQQELREAFENSREVLAEARISLNTSHLSDVFTRENLPKITKAIDDLKVAEDDIFRAEEIEVAWVKVVSVNPPEAIIEVKYFYRPYTFNRKTGNITYDSEPHRYWRIVKYRMLKENNIWKVDEGLEFVDWSG
jgi:hypothetical protein